MIFLDASVLLAAEDPSDRHHHDATSLLESGIPLATLDLCALETTNVAITRWKDAVVAGRLRERVFSIARFGRLERVDDELVTAATELAERVGISVYDAAYAAASRRHETILVSCDERDLVSRDLAQLPASVVADSP